MSNVEHYFENLLFHGHDIKGEPNKNALSKEVQDAVEQCAIYIKYTYNDAERKTGKWVDRTFCSNCNWYAKNRYGLATWSSFPYCPNCGAKMEIDE